MDRPGHVRLRVLDVTGREVAVVLDDTLDAGEHRPRFDAGALAAGTYLVVLDAGGSLDTQTITRVPSAR